MMGVDEASLLVLTAGVTAVVTFFAKSICQFVWDGVLALLKRRDKIDLRGQWKSTFTWEPDRGTETDTIEVKQIGRTVFGRTVSGTYQYKFKGRLVDGILVGQWESLKRPLLGPFQLQVDVETVRSASGYWIGNGTNTLYRGRWEWTKAE